MSEKFYKPTLTELKDSFLVTKLGIILVTGYSISLCVLFFEILLDKLEKRFNLSQCKFIKVLNNFLKEY